MIYFAMFKSFVRVLEQNALRSVQSSFGNMKNIPMMTAASLRSQTHQIVTRKFSLFTIPRSSYTQKLTSLPGSTKSTNVIRQTGFNMPINRMSSTMKKRRWKMNKHKLRKRRKALRFNTKLSRK